MNKVISNITDLAKYFMKVFVLLLLQKSIIVRNKLLKTEENFIAHFLKKIRKIIYNNINK